jgi:hypothetical protein
VRVEVGKNGAAAESAARHGRSEEQVKSAAGARTREAEPRRTTPSRMNAGKASHGTKAATSGSSEPRQLAWAPVPGAGSYHVELYRGSSRIFAADTVRPAVIVPAQWTEGGHVHRLEPGTLRWYVWPVVDGGRSTVAVVQATLTIPRS